MNFLHHRGDWGRIKNTCLLEVGNDEGQQNGVGTDNSEKRSERAMFRQILLRPRLAPLSPATSMVGQGVVSSLSNSFVEEKQPMKAPRMVGQVGQCLGMEKE
ncbi:hypothetical protein SLEP1_g34313 [Rubroshorea leprosula]|uniref:Uncharacterized protein n=1 Tax=Rubroshorea leprosula TaxID=152421 RepID=A0AAV5KJE8_9ROSI|nr:hypothetical protein SLEP1_g34313 [Rubroshorea leprosula]